MKPPAPELSGAPVLVTGGAGFIGSHLVEELVRRGARVTVVDDLSSGRADNLRAVAEKVELHRLDLARDRLDPVVATGAFAIVFHLAGYANIPRSVREPRQDFERNVLGTLNLLEALRAADSRCALVSTSSAAVYGAGSARPLREDDPLTPVAPYGVSKLATEHYVGLYARLYGLRTASLRLFPVYGPRLHSHVVWDLMRKVHEDPRQLPLEGDGSQVRDFVHVTDAVAAFLSAAERAPLAGEAYNVGSGDPVTIAALAQMICEQMGASPRFVYSARVGPGVSQSWTADISRLAELGYRPRLALREGLRGTVEWFRREGAGR
jgi:UDP-glucose 4-epimerase